MLLAGFVAAFRRSELAAIRVDDLDQHPNGLVPSLLRTKTNQTGDQNEFVVLPRAANPDRCPVRAIEHWQDRAKIAEGPLLRRVLKSNKAPDRPLKPDSINTIVQLTPP